MTRNTRDTRGELRQITVKDGEKCDNCGHDNLYTFGKCDECGEEL